MLRPVRQYLPKMCKFTQNTYPKNRILSSKWVTYLVFYWNGSLSKLLLTVRQYLPFLCKRSSSHIQIFISEFDERIMESSPFFLFQFSFFLFQKLSPKKISPPLKKLTQNTYPKKLCFLKDIYYRNRNTIFCYVQYFITTSATILTKNV